MKNKWLAAVIIYVGLMLICIVAIYAVPSVKGILDKTYVAEPGQLDLTDNVTAYIVRDETVYVAGKDCTVNRLAEKNKLVKSGTRVAELTPDEPKKNDESGSEEKTDKSEKSSKSEKTAKSDKDDNTASEISAKYTAVMNELGDNVRVTDGGYCKEAGYVSYYVDGAEADLGKENLPELKMEDYKKYTAQRAVETPSHKCAKGEPVFKIVNNSKWYLVFYLDPKDSSKYTEGTYVDLTVKEDNVRAMVKEVAEGSDISRVTLICKTFFDGFLDERKVNISVTVARADGLMLEDSSIVIDEEGQKGVFVKNKIGEHKYAPIAVKADDGKRCVVYSDIYVDKNGNFVETIKAYDQIVEQPSEEDLKSRSSVMLKDKIAADEKASKDEETSEDEG